METEAIRILEELTEQGNSRGYVSKLQCLKQWAAMCRENEPAHKLIMWALHKAEPRIKPEDLTVFREFYLAPPTTARKISERHYIDVCTLYRRINIVFAALMPVVFGVDGIHFESRGGPP